MMTRQEYILKKTELENRMHQIRIEEKMRVRELNLDYDDRLAALHDEYRRKRKDMLAERDDALLGIEAEFKAQRQDLWAEDTELVARWRNQLNQEGGEV